MADVELVLQTTPAGVERLAVIKRARPELARQPEYAAMFWEEARIAASLSHQNVVQTYEVGQDDDGYFMILEFLRGQSYAQVLTRAGYADYRFSLEVLLCTLQGLEHAHGMKQMSGDELSVVHRDISPPNVFVTYDGQVKVLDFGIAKARGSMIQTEAGVVKGKVAYMAPEQMLGAPCDLRADLYAVGVMLWEATAGEQRFKDITDHAISSSVTSQRAPLLPGAVERGLPQLADAICLRALARDPADRYSSAAAFHDELASLAALVGGRMSSRAVGEYVAERFVNERKAQQTRIEAELSPHADGPQRAAPVAFAEPEPEPEPGSGTRALALEHARVHARVVSESAPRKSTSAPPEAATPAPRGPSWKRRAALAVGLAALVALGLKAGAALSGASEQPAPSASSALVPTPIASSSAAVALEVGQAAPVDSSAPVPSAAAAPSTAATSRKKSAPKPPVDPAPRDEFGGRR